MPVTCSIENRVLTACISGDVDHHGAKAVMQRLDTQIDLGLPKRLILDLSGVTFMDSSGIAILLRAWRRMGELSGTMTVSGVPAQAARVLRAAGVDRLITFE
ncbi:MAG: STAS domain-containing protein [Clostridiales bacterium]|nr:STAS domain-containing protein [Clostridiales bacterium]